VTTHRSRRLTGPIGSAVETRLLEACLVESFDLLAYTVMPDHIHMLVHGLRSDSNALRLVKRFKQTTSYHFVQRTGEKHLWQQSFYDHVLRPGEDPVAIAQYIVDNPVRAELAARFEDWPLTGGTLLGR
jgi:REP element-mobilizing transposase RayT